jgi:soluble lytic murein transglycosylase-like protein
MPRHKFHAICFLLASVFALAAESALAERRGDPATTTRPYPACLGDAANYWGVPPALAHAIAQQESGMHPGIVSKNRDGSLDIGLMQINSSWLPKLAPYGITAHDLLNNACVNAYVGNWILAQNIQRLGYNWDAVGAYNSPTAANRYRYAIAIFRRLMTAQAANSMSLDR